MIAKVAIEAVIYSLVYTVFMLILFKIQGAEHQLYNYPKAIKDRAKELGIITQEELDANAKKNKIWGIIVMVVLCVAITCAVNKQTTFLAGLLTIITTVFANGIISTILMLVYIILASVIAVIYSKKNMILKEKRRFVKKFYLCNKFDRFQFVYEIYR